MKELSEQADQIVRGAKEIAVELFAYNPGSGQKKVSLDHIQHDVATLTRDLTGLYADIGKKIKEEQSEINSNG